MTVAGEVVAGARVPLSPGGDRLAMSTDSFVVQPRRFPGGSIGELAVHGTCNDLAMAGAVPSWMAAAFVLEEGFPIAELKEIVCDRNPISEGMRQALGKRFKLVRY